MGRKNKLIAFLSACMVLAAVLSWVKYGFCTRAAEDQGINSETDTAIQEESVQEEGAQDNIIIRTPTSIVRDMGMQPGDLAAGAVSGSLNTPYPTLSVPTQIIKTGGLYFIVDAYHNQVLYNTQLQTDIKEWKIMTKDVELPHSIASDGDVFLVTDTEGNRILVFRWTGSNFRHVQTFSNVGDRPHYIAYDSGTQEFFAWSSQNGEMYVFKNDTAAKTVCLSQIRQIVELQDYYVRSFTIMGDKILFPSGTNSYIIVADKNTLEVLERYPVPADIAGMAYAEKIGGYYYLTISCDLMANQDVATMIRTTDLANLSEGVYERIYLQVYPAADGIPYYIDYFDGAFYLTLHGASKSVARFNIVNDTIISERTLY